MDEARKSAREAATLKAAEVLKACFEFGGARPVRDVVGEILDAYEAALKEMGLVIVPKVADKAMCDRGQDAAYRFSTEGIDEHCTREVWSAMIAAASQGEGT